VTADGDDLRLAAVATHGNHGKSADGTSGGRGRTWSSGATIRVLLTKREAAEALGMSVRHFERHVQARLQCVHSGQLTLYRLRDLERWADAEATLGGRATKRVR
jgi:hypothetical protein